MLLPPLTDFVALTGLDLVLCAVCLQLLSVKGVDIAAHWKKTIFLVCFLLLWIPVGSAQIPVLAYIRGISSDLSITLVALACISLRQCVSGEFVLQSHERVPVLMSVAVAALFLYPLALGWGNWDAYRPGWGAPSMWVILLLISMLAWIGGLRLLPTLVSFSLLAWTAGVLESTNLWDYLLDPWLAVFAIFECIRLVSKKIHIWRTRTIPYASVPSRPT